jgi:hypothetical protein
MNNMAKQMEMFETGGLMDEGGTVDPVSGNDVPPGSTQEEVRDDIPAQLSEGEFVFPADVVRYFGLEKLMEMRQEAKMGLQRMDDMGQMGNSEEAIMPDNLPFDIDDIDMEDDNEPQEFNLGGVVQAPGTGIAGYTPPPMPTTGYTPPPVGVAVAPVVPGSQPQVAFTPSTSTTNIPTFGQFVGTGAGKYDELVTYVNDAGQTMQIPHVNGKPIYPVPEGFKKQDTSAGIVPDSTIVDTTKVKTATVQDDDGGGGAGDEGIQSSASVTLGGQSGTGKQKGLRVGDYKTFGVSYDVPGGLPGVAGALSTVGGLALGKGLPAGATANIFDRDFPNASVTVSAADFNAMKAAGYKGELADMYKGALSTTADVLNNKAVNIAAPVGTQTGRMLDANGNPIGDKAQGIVEKAVVESVLSNVKTSVPGFLGQINNFGKVSFEEAVANANDAQKAVLDNMGVDYDTSLDVTAAEKADMARQEEKAMADAIAAANKAKADRAAAKASQDKRDAEKAEAEAAGFTGYGDYSSEDSGSDSDGPAGNDGSDGEAGGGAQGGGYGGGTDCLTEDMKVKLNGVIDFVTNIKVGDMIDNYRVKEVLHKHMRSGYYAINNELKISNDHPVLANGTWTRPEDLVVGDNINGIPVSLLEYVEQLTPTVSIVIDGESFDVHTENNIYTVHGRYREVRQEAA